MLRGRPSEPPAGCDPELAVGCGRPREADRDAERNPLPTASSLSPCKEAVTRETFTNAVVQLTYVVQSSGSESPWTWPWPWTHKVSTEGADDHQDGRWGRRPVLGPVPSHRPPRIPPAHSSPLPSPQEAQSPGPPGPLSVHLWADSTARPCVPHSSSGAVPTAATRTRR